MCIPYSVDREVIGDITKTPKDRDVIVTSPDNAGVSEISDGDTLERNDEFAESLPRESFDNTVKFLQGAWSPLQGVWPDVWLDNTGNVPSHV